MVIHDESKRVQMQVEDMQEKLDKKAKESGDDKSPGRKIKDIDEAAEASRHGVMEQLSKFRDEKLRSSGGSALPQCGGDGGSSDISPGCDDDDAPELPLPLELSLGAARSYGPYNSETSFVLGSASVHICGPDWDCLFLSASTQLEGDPEEAEIHKSMSPAVIPMKKKCQCYQNR